MRGSIALGWTQAPAGHLRFDRGGRGPGRRRARDHRRRVPQPAPHRDGAPGGPDRAVRDLPRHRQAQAPALHQGLPVPVAVQHLPASRPAARARSTHPAGGASRRRSIPAKVPYLYFVAGPDGRHVFSRTYDEHLRAIARVARAIGGSCHPSAARRHDSRRGSSRAQDDPLPVPAYTARGLLDVLLSQNPRHHRHPRPAGREHRGDILRPHRRRWRCTASRPRARTSRPNPSGPSASPASALVPVDRQGPIPQ